MARAILVGPCINDKKMGSSRRLFKLHPSDIRVGVDGGIQVWRNWGLEPHFAVGDWDSFTGDQAIFSHLRHVSLSIKKDRSDLFYSVLAAIEAGAREILCLGVTGGRPDHHLATLMDLSLFSTGKYGKVDSIQAIDLDAEYVFLSSQIPKWKASSRKGTLISVFAMGAQKTSGVSLSGFQYPLKNMTLVPSSHGLSNRVNQSKFEVYLRKGQLLVILPRDEQEPSCNKI